MATLIPFRGVRYNPVRIHNINLVVAPPYDVIDDAAQRALHERHPHNVIRLELGLDQPDDGPGRNRYTRAGAWLTEWLTKGVLVRDPEAALYPYQVEYQDPSDPDRPVTRVLKGFLATIELADFGSGRIYPHENTRAAAKADRLSLMEACRANVSPIFSLFSDPDGTIPGIIDRALECEKPCVELQDADGLRHRLWRLADPGLLRATAEALAPKPLFIADGHHRYETALAYRTLRRRRAGLSEDGTGRPFDNVLMFCSSLEEPGLTVLPTHRVLRATLPEPQPLLARLRRLFQIEEIAVGGGAEPDARRRLLRVLRAQGDAHPAFGMAVRNAPAYYVLTLKPEHRPPVSGSPRERLDVSLLHHHLLEPLALSKTDEEAIIYTKDAQEAVDLVRQGAGTAALLLNPTKVSEVRAVAAAGERMPHKSTYFFPKPITGLVLNVMEE
jgi:uncharacterized protein (DUF1015 family)